MENASKALFIVAGVLMSIMILSLGVYIFSLFGDFSSNIEKDREKQQIEAFNAKFYKYQELEKVTAHDIVTVINLARQSNEQNEYEYPAEQQFKRPDDRGDQSGRDQPHEAAGGKPRGCGGSGA